MSNGGVSISGAATSAKRMRAGMPSAVAECGPLPACLASSFRPAAEGGPRNGPVSKLNLEVVGPVRNGVLQLWSGSSGNSPVLKAGRASGFVPRARFDGRESLVAGRPRNRSVRASSRFCFKTLSVTLPRPVQTRSRRP